MNLSGMFEEDMSLNNVKWLEEAETYQPKGKDINKKDDLAIEWKTDLSIPEEMPVSIIEDEMIVSKDIMQQIVDSARVLLHQGLSKKSIIRQLQAHFKPEDIKNAKDELKELFENEGFTGVFVIDLRDVDNVLRERIYKAWKKSKYSRLAKYVLMDQEAIDSRNGITAIKSQTNEIVAGSIDTFIDNCNKKTKDEVGLVHDMFGLPVYAGYADLPEEDYDDTYIDLLALGYITEDEKEELKSMPLKQASKNLYKLLRSKQNRKEVVADHSKDFKINKADNEIKLSEVKKQEELSVDVTKENKQFSKELEVEVKDNSMLDVSVKKADNELEISEKPLGLLDVSVKKADNELEISGKDDFNIDDPYQVVDEEFKGSDAFEFDPEKETKGEFDIDHRGSFDF